MEIILWFPFNIPLSEFKKYLQKPTVSLPIIIVLLFFVVAMLVHIGLKSPVFMYVLVKD